MALLPTLAAHIFEGMDVEGVTRELQLQTRVSRAQTAIQTPVLSSETSSVEIQPSPSINDAQSENGSVSVISYPGPEDTVSSPALAASSQSWVEHMSVPSASHSSPEASSSSGYELSGHSYASSPKSNIGTDLSDSFITNSSAISYGDVMVGLQIL